MNRTLLAGFALAVGSTAVAQQGAHEHGVADLRVVLDGHTLLIELESPLQNLVGFEHAPRDAAQRRKLAEAEDNLHSDKVLFATTPEAGCVLQELIVESPYPQHAKGSGAHHRDDHDHDHDHAEGDGHADMYAVYEFACDSPDALTALEVKLIDVFPGIETIRAQTHGSAGQRAERLNNAISRLQL